MKRAQRHHLKDNELVNLAASARHVVEERRGQVTAIAVTLVVILAVGLGYYAWRGRTQGQAGRLLAEAMAIDDARVGPPPAPGSPAPPGLSFVTSREKFVESQKKFKVVADQYPSTDSGLFARYREAAAWMALGDTTNAATAYQQVIDGAGDKIYGQMARLGLAEAHAQAGQYDQAIATFKDLAAQKDGQLPVDGVLIRLGMVYLDAGKRQDAEQTFNRLVDEFPDSPFAPDAKRELDQLKRT